MLCYRLVTPVPNYGHYSLHTKTANKRTTLSALYMFLALTNEGLSNIKRAIMFCNKAISEDPGWMIPFNKRAEYFQYFEQQLTQTAGGSNEEILRARISADIIVDPCADEESMNIVNDGGVRIVNNLENALALAKDGDKIFLEEGRYYREDGFSISCRVSLTGASSSECVIVSCGSPTLQICSGLKSASSSAGSSPILLTRLQLLNLTRDMEQEDLVTSSNASHLYIISPDTVTVKDCLFNGGEHKTGGILIAEEAFYKSLLELEFENPEMLSGESGCGMANTCLKLFVDFCVFSDCSRNCCLFSNNQSVVIMSNSVMRGCGRTGVSAGEGSSVSIINSHISDCSMSCVSSDNVSTLNILGSMLADSRPLTSDTTQRSRQLRSAVVATDNSKVTVSRSLLRNHCSAVTVEDAHLVFDENCVTDIMDESITSSGLQLDHAAMYLSRAGNIVISRNNFYNCNLVWQLQHGACPRIESNYVDTCLVAVIASGQSQPRIEHNTFSNILISIGMFTESSAGNLYKNIFKYISNGLEIANGCSPVLVKNVYKCDKISGVESGLKFDFLKVKGEGCENMSDDSITVTEESDETLVVEELMR